MFKKYFVVLILVLSPTIAAAFPASDEGIAIGWAAIDGDGHPDMDFVTDAIDYAGVMFEGWDSYGFEYLCPGDVTSYQLSTGINAYIYNVDFPGCQNSEFLDPFVSGYLSFLDREGGLVTTRKTNMAPDGFTIKTFSRSTPQSSISMSYFWGLGDTGTTEIAMDIVDEAGNVLFAGAPVVSNPIRDYGGLSFEHAVIFPPIPEDVIALPVERFARFRLTQTFDGVVNRTEWMDDSFPLTVSRGEGLGCQVLLHIARAGEATMPSEPVTFGCPTSIPPEPCADASTRLLKQSRDLQHAVRVVGRKCDIDFDPECASLLATEIAAFEEISSTQEVLSANCRPPE